jgi:hypothetical protein
VDLVMNTFRLPRLHVWWAPLTGHLPSAAEARSVYE